PSSGTSAKRDSARTVGQLPSSAAINPTNPLAEQEQEAESFFIADQVKDYCREDLNFFAGVAAPEDATLEFPNFYIWLWSQLISLLSEDSVDFSKYAIGLPRGHGKTFLVKLLIVYAVLFTKKRYILVVGANSAKAEAIIDDIKDFLDSYNIQSVFGNWRI